MSVTTNVSYANIIQSRLHPSKVDVVISEMNTKWEVIFVKTGARVTGTDWKDVLDKAVAYRDAAHAMTGNYP